MAILFVLGANNMAFSQSEKINIGIQLNPVVHYNNAEVSDRSLGKMYAINIGVQTGAEVNYNINDRWTISPMVKFYSKSQRIEQSQYFGYLSDGSKSYAKYIYSSTDFGILLKYRLYKNIHLVGGVSYSMANLTQKNWAYKYNGSDNYNGALTINFEYGTLNLGTKVNMFHPLIGIRNNSRIKNVGIFEYGLLFYIPTKDMPSYQYNQTLITDDKGEINSNVSYKSRQYTMEVSLVYYLFNFNRHYKLVHPKRNNYISSKVEK